MIFLPRIHINKKDNTYNAMILSSCILITIPVCISAILMQTYFDSRKYKRIPHLIVLLSFLFPTLSHAQYIDNENCRISFKSYENHQGKLEYNKEGIIYQFIPNSNAWKVIIKNNTDETVWLNWKQAGFIVNGRASGISLYPLQQTKLLWKPSNTTRK